MHWQTFKASGHHIRCMMITNNNMRGDFDTIFCHAERNIINMYQMLQEYKNRKKIIQHSLKPIIVAEYIISASQILCENLYSDYLMGHTVLLKLSIRIYLIELYLSTALIFSFPQHAYAYILSPIKTISWP